jgi:hypothetical protein
MGQKDESSGGNVKTKRKKKHECNGMYCFHGAFNKRSDAEAKKRRVGGSAFIQGKWVGRGRSRYAYIVMERDSAAEFTF